MKEKKDNKPRRKDIDLRQMLSDRVRPSQYKLDTRFVLTDGKKHPFAIICPGGGYRMICSYIEGVPIAKKLNEQGISAFILYYRVRKKAIFQIPLDDLATATREILRNADKYRIDRKNYTVWGFSAGGHLAGCFGTKTLGYFHYLLPKPKAIILSYPVISMDKALTQQAAHDTLLGKNPPVELEAAFSVDQIVTSSYPPVYIWCGEDDKDVSPENTRAMDKALQEAHIPHKCEIFPGVGHGVGTAIGTPAEEWIPHAIEFWRSL